jgi:SEC-C motif-containing protein
VTKSAKRPASPAAKTCLCGSGASYSVCCEPLHAGERSAQTPFELVRARYAAFALGRADYLWATLHADHDAQAAGEAAYRQGVERMQRGYEFRGAELLDERPEDSYGAAQVLFQARVFQHKRDLSFVERADFVKDPSGWRYLGGESKPASELAHGPDELTLDHWQCGHDHHH